MTKHSKRDFREIYAAMNSSGRCICVGLDSEAEEVAGVVRMSAGPFATSSFNKPIIEETRDIAGAYKINPKYYENPLGRYALKETVNHIRAVAPEALIILDAKYSDVQHSNAVVARYAFDDLGVDAVTIVPINGQSAFQPFLSRKDKGVFAVCKNSGKGWTEFQSLRVRIDGSRMRPPSHNQDEYITLYKYFASDVADYWNGNGNCGLVVGGDNVTALHDMRVIAPKLPILIPGIGEQGGDPERALDYGMDAKGGGIILTASRSIIFASRGKDFAEAARKEVIELQHLFDKCRKKKISQK